MTEQTDEEILEQLMLEQEIAKNQILNHGISFDIPKRSLLKYIPWGPKNDQGQRVRRFYFYKLYVSTMDVMAELKLQVKINITTLQKSENPIREKNQIIKDNNKIMCKLIAVGMLNRGWKIKLFSGILAGYISERLLPENLLIICRKITDLEDAANFINSTVLIAGTPRTTKPKAEKIEENPTKAPVKQ